jgi:hypothetical protein
MIIDLNKCEPIYNMKINLCDLSPVLYFLFEVTEKTPRYKRVNNTYIQDQKGNYVIDHGMDILNKVPRVVKYIGQGIHGGHRRLVDHYTHENEKGTHYGVGPVFNYVRKIKGFKRLGYDSVRIHHETLLVRKYLPELNKASQLTDNQKLIILNSKGLVTPYHLMVPYNIHARDIYKAYQAWLIEDMDYIKKELVLFETKNKAGIVKKSNPQSYRRRGKKLKFSVWFSGAVLRFHKKQHSAYTEFCKTTYTYIQLYDEERYESTKMRKRENIKKLPEEKKEQNRIYGREYKKIKRKLNQDNKFNESKQPELI